MVAKIIVVAAALLLGGCTSTLSVETTGRVMPVLVAPITPPLLDMQEAIACSQEGLRVTHGGVATVETGTSGWTGIKVVQHCE